MKNTFKPKIFNDPIYGFVSVPTQLCFDIIEHPYFQRLRRIKQLGATHLVYPGALHTRFHHALGAMHLMSAAIQVLRSKGLEISDEESEAACVAILLHDIGHGPYSHSLEYLLAEGLNHEYLSALFMKYFSRKYGGALEMALAIFNNTYHRKFLHQLVSSQLDVDRLDYLKRDSFYTGVSEGVISTERIISMLNVADDSLAVELKGIYSVEKFLIARRLMYWQVYLHKTVVACENLLVNILKRAKSLAIAGHELFASPALHYFLYNRFTEEESLENDAFLDSFARLDDSDVFLSIKVWMNHEDKVLSKLSTMFVNRTLFKISMRKESFSDEEVRLLREKFMKSSGFSEKEAAYFVFTDSIANNAYDARVDRINILLKNGKTIDVTEAADQLNLMALSDPVEKYFLCYPKP